MKVVYLAGQYAPKTEINGLPPDWTSPEVQAGIDQNISLARAYAVKLWEHGFAVICPHLNTAHMELDCRASHEDYLTGDFAIISRCDVVAMLPNWMESKGARMEHMVALALGKEVWYLPDPSQLGRFLGYSP